MLRERKTAPRVGNLAAHGHVVDRTVVVVGSEHRFTAECLEIEALPVLLLVIVLLVGIGFCPEDLVARIGDRTRGVDIDVSERYGSTEVVRQVLVRLERNDTIGGSCGPLVLLVRAADQSQRCAHGSGNQDTFHKFNKLRVCNIKKRSRNLPRSNPFYPTHPITNVLRETPQDATMLRSPQMRSKKKILPPGKLQGRSSGSSPSQRLPSRKPVAPACCDHQSGFTAAGTAADFHGIPFSSQRTKRPSPDDRRSFVNHCGAKLENKFVSLPLQTKKLL